MKTEFFPIVNEKGEIIGKESREKCHSGSFLLHPVVHLHVLNSNNEIYLQKRAKNKDVQPGKWDTSVGGHVDYGETIEEALKREAFEELGIQKFEPEFLYQYIYTSDIESELVYSYFTFYDGIISPSKDEISEGRFWKDEEIEQLLKKGIFTPNFEYEWKKWKEWKANNK